MSGRDAQPSAPAPNLQPGAMHPHSAPAPETAIGKSVASYSISNDSSSAPLSICPKNPALVDSNLRRSAFECRVYIYHRDGGYADSTAWFVTKRSHVVTAGHAVADGGTGTYNVREINGAFGIVCCDPSPSGLVDDCGYDARFYIDAVVAPNEWVYDGKPDNDGAVLRVKPYDNTSPNCGVPLKFGSISADPCSHRIVYWGGYPEESSLSFGCRMNFQETYWYSEVEQYPYYCPADNSGERVYYTGNSCPGMSGGSLLDVASDLVVGILTGSSVTCDSNGESNVVFTQLVENDVPGAGGVCLAALLAAIP